MDEPGSTYPVLLRDKRERTINVLCAHFAADHLDVAEFERRVDIAHRVASMAELDPLLADLPSLEPPTAEPGRALGPRVAAPEDVTDRQVIVAIMGGVERKGHWIPPKHLVSLALMGGFSLDFREAALGRGVTEVTIVAVMGGAEIIVPPGLAVETSGIAIMGGFEHRAELPPSRDPNTPVLRINGFALMGGVEITVRLPGETAKDAKERARDERRRLKEERRRR